MAVITCKRTLINRSKTIVVAGRSIILAAKFKTIFLHIILYLPYILPVVVVVTSPETVNTSAIIILSVIHVCIGHTHLVEKQEDTLTHQETH